MTPCRCACPTAPIAAPGVRIGIAALGGPAVSARRQGGGYANRFDGRPSRWEEGSYGQRYSD